MKKAIVILFSILAFGGLSKTWSQVKPELIQIKFLRNGASVDTTSLGDLTVELKFSRPMDESIDPVVNFGLAAPYSLNVPKGQGWISNALWQGFFTVSEDNPETPDGEYIFKVYGARDFLDTEMDTTFSTALDKSLFICRRGKLSVKEDSLDYGVTRVGSDESLVVTLQNLSCAPLKIKLSSLSAPFFIVGSSDFTLLGEKSRKVNILFSPTSRSTFTDALVIESSDPDQPMREIPLTGKASGSRLTAWPSSPLEFGNLGVGQDSVKTVWVANEPAEDEALSDTLVVSEISTTNPAYLTSVSGLMVAPGDTESVRITFRPTEFGNYDGNRMDMHSNDPDRPVVFFELNGEAIDRSPPPAPRSFSVNWDGYAGMTNTSVLPVCWEPTEDASGIAEVWWKFTAERTPPRSADDTTSAGGRLVIQPNTSCVALPLFGRLTTGRWYCYVWFVDGRGNSGYASAPATETMFTYDTTPPGKPSLLRRRIPAAQWFTASDTFSLTLGLPADADRGVRDASEIRWKFKTPPTSAVDFIQKRTIMSPGPEEVTVDVSFSSISLCGEDTLYVWLADSLGNSDPNARAAVSYRFDVCNPIISRVRKLSENIAMLGNTFRDTLTITDESGLDSAWVRYRFGGAEAEEPARKVTQIAGTNSYVVDIPAAGVTRRGIEYQVVARDLVGLETRGPREEALCSDEDTWFPVRTRIEGEGDFRIDSDGRPVPLIASEDETRYQLFSIPYDLDQQTMAAVMQDELGTYDVTQWRFFDYQPDKPEDARWLEGKDARPFIPGRSYFVATRKQNIIVDSGPGQTRRTVCPDSIRLYQGWNLIATPFNFPVHKDALTIKYGEVDSLNVTLRSFERGWNITDVMEPWRGYALYVPRIDGDHRPIYLIVQPKAVAGRIDKTGLANFDLQPGEWMIRISAEAGELQDRDNWAGVRQSAREGFDQLELAEPPVIGKYLRVAFPRSDWQQPADYFSTDFRSARQPEQAWDVEVASNLSEERVNLSFEIQGELPDDAEIFLIDEQQGVAQDVRLQPHYSIESGEAGITRTLKLLVGGRAFIEEMAGAIMLVPEKFELLQNFPNPFNPSTTIRYTLPQAERVKLVLYDLLGRELRNLIDEPKKAGYHSVRWDGRDEQGRPVPSGVYIYKITAGSHAIARKMVLVK